MGGFSLAQRALIVGAGGQLGQELQRTVGPAFTFDSVTRSQLDITDAGAVAQQLALSKAELVINAAAYTAVDKAESEREAARMGNEIGPQVLAQACADLGLRFIHISTDFVFDGTSSVPYTPQTIAAPLGEYGRTKLAGEIAVQQALPTALIIRTGWVYSAFGGNFVKTMLRLMASNDELTVVADQVGTPTWANGLASAVWAAAAQDGLTGVYHWSDAGVCSWYDFAVAICEEAVELGLLSKAIKVRPIPAVDYPTPAQRPSYSVLDKTASWADFQLPGVHWREQLRAMLKDFKELENG